MANPCVLEPEVDHPIVLSLVDFELYDEINAYCIALGLVTGSE